MQESVFKLANEAIPSYVANIYEHANDKGVAASAEEEELVKLTAVSMYGGGSDTVCVLVEETWPDTLILRQLSPDGFCSQQLLPLNDALSRRAT